MSDGSPYPGWWLASDGRWYPPDLHPGRVAGQADRGATGPVFQGMGRPGEGLADWAPAAGGAAVAPPIDGQLPPIGSGGVATPGGRFGRGLRLVSVGFAMVRDEPGLIAVPVVAFLAQLVVIGIGALIAWPSFRGSDTSGGGSIHLSAAQWLGIVVVGVLVTFISVVSHATIIARVMARFHGRRISNITAVGAAMTKSPQLLAWAFINYIVISVLRSIGNRGIFGLLVGWLLRAGWMLASFFVVPVILFENRGAVSSIKRSVELCRARWGENVIGNSALGIIGFAAVVVDIAVAALLGSAFAPLGAVVGALGLAFILLVLTVASAAFNAALYWFAVTDQCPGQYSVGDLRSAYRQKKPQTGIYGF